MTAIAIKSNLEELYKEREDYKKGIASSNSQGLGDAVIKRQQKFLAIVEAEIAELEGEKKNNLQHDPEIVQGDIEHNATANVGGLSNIGNSDTKSDMGNDIETVKELYLFKTKAGAEDFQAYKEQLRLKLLNYLKKLNKTDFDIWQMNLFVPNILNEMSKKIDKHAKDDYKEGLKMKTYFVTHEGKKYTYGFDFEAIKKEFEF